MNTPNHPQILLASALMLCLAVPSWAAESEEASPSPAPTSAVVSAPEDPDAPESESSELRGLQTQIELMRLALELQQEQLAAMREELAESRQQKNPSSDDEALPDLFANMPEDEEEVVETSPPAQTIRYVRVDENGRTPDQVGYISEPYQEPQVIRERIVEIVREPVIIERTEIVRSNPVIIVRRSVPPTFFPFAGRHARLFYPRRICESTGPGGMDSFRRHSRGGGFQFRINFGD